MDSALRGVREIQRDLTRLDKDLIAALGPIEDRRDEILHGQYE